MPHLLAHHPPSRILARLCVLLLPTALLMAGLVTSSATAVTTGTVSGTVTGPDGDGAGSIIVSAKKPGDLSSEGTDLDFTADDGRYSLKVPAGRWVITFEDDGVDLARALRRDVVVAAGGTTTVDTSLRRGVVARGTVSLGHDWTGVDPGPQLSVQLVAQDPDTYPRQSQELGVGDDGTWEVGQLTPGRYRATFGGYLYHSQCYGGRRAASDYEPCRDQGTIVTVGESGAVLDPVVMSYRWAKVTGVVRGPDGKALRDAEVRDLSTDDPDHQDLLSSPRSDGRYSFFVESTQKVRFAPRDADAKKLAGLERTFTLPGANQTVTADVRLRSRTTLTATARAGKRKATVVARVTPRYAGATRSGTVQVRYKKTNGTAAVRSATVPRTGKVSIHLPKARKGKRTLTVTYGGSAQMVATSRKTSVRVR